MKLGGDRSDPQTPFPFDGSASTPLLLLLPAAKLWGASHRDQHHSPRPPTPSPPTPRPPTRSSLGEHQQGQTVSPVSDPLLIQSQVCSSFLGQPHSHHAQRGHSSSSTPLGEHPSACTSPLPGLSSCQHVPGRPPTPGTPTPGTPARETPLTPVLHSLAPPARSTPSPCPTCWGGPGTHAGSPQHPSHSTRGASAPAGHIKEETILSEPRAGGTGVTLHPWVTAHPFPRLGHGGEVST